MNYALIALGHAGLHVRVIDPDHIDRANGGRLLFTEAEIGLPKAIAFVNRINRFFGTDWKAIVRPFGENMPFANIYISCVDNVDARFLIASLLGKMESRHLYRDSPLYWLDLGNDRNGDQVVLATVGRIQQPKSTKFQTVAELPFVTKEYGELLRYSEKHSTMPSCSLAEALEKQELFINPAMADGGASLLWQMFRKGMLTNRGFFMNLETFRMQPIKVGSVTAKDVLKVAA
ncbi:PRTRC system ThiF family protein [Olivibacter sp. XZL3]|uniref:PRTRC system ThiF family protein n=1 Tax=Olivibacter sp. XZL3 TaxID=1735116 RepID=UPI001F0E8C53|nr:PRTRC system ThiF family protein [Olivibacter sp. XZL3]